MSEYFSNIDKYAWHLVCDRGLQLVTIKFMFEVVISQFVCYKFLKVIRESELI